MKNKRFLSGLLACVMLLSILPTSAFATEPNVYTGVDARIPSVEIGDAVADVDIALKVATDYNASTYTTNHTLSANLAWYYAYHLTDEIPEEERDEYTVYEYGAIAAYVKPVDNGSIFENRMYLCVATISTTNQFAENCEVYPGACIVSAKTQNTMTLNFEVYPHEIKNVITELEVQVDSQGYTTINNANNEYTYVYRVNDGTYDETIYNMPTGQTVGTYSINNCDYQELTAQINIYDHPQIIMMAVNTEEWKYEKTSTVYQASVYTIPLSAPYITVNTLEFGEDIRVLDVGSSIVGSYNNNLAQVKVNGWFADKEGTVPLTVESDGYLVCTIISYSLFDAEIQPHHFTLKCGNETFTGENFIPYASSNAYKVAFFVPSNRISLSLEAMTPGGSIIFYNYEDTNILSLQPNDNGEYGAYDIGIIVEPGYYVKGVYINNQPWESAQNPFANGKYYRISSTNGHVGNITEFQPTEDTHISVEFAKADTITIQYGDNIPLYSGDENLWHEDGRYYVAETYGTTLCKQYAFTNSTYTQHVLMLNTQEDGSGTTANLVNGSFVWSPNTEHQNGISDTITLYVIMECDMHSVGGEMDNSWQYVNATPATCTSEGCIAHRYCPECGIYQTLNANGMYVFTPRSEIFADKLPHEYTVYNNTSETHHTVKCEHCVDSYTEEHKLVNGVCVCGYFTYLKGDVNKDGSVTDADAVYLLYYTIFPEDYPINQPADFNGDGSVTDADAVYLLYYTIFPEDYPLM